VNLSTPSKVADQIEVLRSAELDRAPARALVDVLFNGGSPWSEKEAEENHIHLNANFGEPSDLLLQARQQYENAFLTTGNFFSVKLPDAPASKREAYEQRITAKANRALKKSRVYLQTERQKFGSMALHGPGPQMWEDDEEPLPYFVAVPDLLIPTDTDITLCDCYYFFVRRKMKPGSLFRKTFNRGKNVDPGWNLSAVRKILDTYKEINQNPNNYDWANQPEAMQEIYKQNLLWFEQDSAPTIWAWDAYWQEDEGEDQSWQRGMILDRDTVPVQNGETAVQWLFRSGHCFDDKGKPEAIAKARPFAQNIDQILQINFCDGNTVPPFMYHSCRGIGLRLYDAAMIKNRLQCQFLQKVFEDMMLLFRANDPADKARLNEIFLGFLYGVIPEGLAMVKREDRYEIDSKLVEMGMGFLKQNMGEGASPYTQQINTDDKKERTAFEVNTLLNQATKITSSMLNLAYLQEDFSYAEICRRLANPKTHNFMAKRFQAECQKDNGVPDKWMDSRRWEVASERTMGGGNAQIEFGQAQALQQIRQTLNPKGQAIVTNKYVFAVTHDPDLTEEIAPREGAPSVSNTQHDSQIAFGILMDGYPMSPMAGLNPMEVVATIVPLMEAEVKNVMAGGGVGTGDHIKGLLNCEQYVKAYLQELAGDKSNAQFVKQFGDRLGRVMNEVKAMAQRQQQAAQAQAKAAQQNGNGNGGIDPKKSQELAFDEQKHRQDLAHEETRQRQKMAHRQQEFQSSQQQKKAATLNDISLRNAESASKPRQNKPTGFDE
jgi:hypothetical protein